MTPFQFIPKSEYSLADLDKFHMVRIQRQPIFRLEIAAGRYRS